ncbi:MAG: M23 family metallopeptidase [Gammaproteobacteria bacterium]
MQPDVMDARLIADAEARQVPSWLTGWLTGWLTCRLLPGALGVCAAALLGATGFGLGAFYGEATGPRVLATEASPPIVRGSAPAVAEAIGGPEEPAPVTLPVQPAAQLVSAGPPASAARNSGRAPGRDLDQDLGRAFALGRPVLGGWISSSYGQRIDPFTGQPAVHRGLDFAGLTNSAILAVAPGIVTWSDRRSGYGNLIEIDHGRGWVTRYGHNAFNLVQVGDYVKPGQTIALMGATGRATGTHLHFEVRYRGRPQNPARLIPRDA